MRFGKSMKKILAARGYKHRADDKDFSRHGDYARNMQYTFSKEFVGQDEKVIDVIFLSADMYTEMFVIGFFRENVSIENGIIENGNTTIPLANFSLEEFEKKLDQLISKEPLLKKHYGDNEAF